MYVCEIRYNRPGEVMGHSSTHARFPICLSGLFRQLSLQWHPPAGAGGGHDAVEGQPSRGAQALALLIMLLAASWAVAALERLRTASHHSTRAPSPLSCNQGQLAVSYLRYVL